MRQSGVPIKFIRPSDMKFIRYTSSHDRTPLYGCIIDDVVHRINGNFFAEYDIGEAVGSLKDIVLHCPLLPGNIIGLAANYLGTTGATPQMKEPLVFMKPGTAACGPYEDIIGPFKDSRVWGEVELGIVVGKTVKKASKTEATEAIFGYLCANDVTANNVEGRDHHLLRSKGADTFCPLGPWIDTDFDPKSAAIESFQNGTLIRQGNLGDRIWRDDFIIWWLSQWMTLNPGDVIITGAPPRVVDKVYLQEGDVYEAKIHGLGSLRNVFKMRGYE